MKATWLLLVIFVAPFVVFQPATAQQAASPIAPPTQDEKPPTICLKHLEPPRRYPALARQARLQGTVVIKLKIAEDGRVVGTESSPGDKDTVGFPVLKDDAEGIVKTWTFGCAGCPPNAPFEHTIKFKYVIAPNDDVTVQAHLGVLMDLPDEVIIKTDSPQCDHCPAPRHSKKGSS